MRWPASSRRPCYDWRGLDLPGNPVVLAINGTVTVEGEGSAILGDPMNSLAWLANLAASLDEGLHAGEIVTLGTCTGLTPVSSGDRVIVTYGTLGTVEISF